MTQDVTPQFRITDAKASLAFYVDGLGFTVDWEHRFEPGMPVFMAVSRDGQSLFLSEHAGDARVGGAAYFVVPDVDACAREFGSRGVTFVQPPQDMPWGPRELTVVDPDGNRLRFASGARGPQISVMLAVPDAPAAAAWYERALGATRLWDLGSVVGLEIAGAPFFLGQPEKNNWATPATLGRPSCRVEVFCDQPDAFVARAVECGATAPAHGVRDHQMPWGVHRQGGFVDPFGHIWFVGDRSPLRRHGGAG
jgi:PhnB protein